MEIHEALRSYSQSYNMLIESDRYLIMATSRDKNQDTDNEKHSQSQSRTPSPLMDSDLKAEGNNEEITSKDRIKSESQEEEDFIETCSCGHSRNHHLVTPRATYTTWGTFWITIMGVSATPLRVEFICRMCNEKFDFEIDPERLKDFY